MTVEKLLLPPGRIVWGNPMNPQVKKNYTTQQPIIKDGQQVQEWACGIAIDKAQFNANVMPHFQQEAATMYPSGLPADFSWKLTDGDGIDNNGKPFADREGYAGCWVLKVSTEAFAPRVYKFENNEYRQLEPHEIKTGDYVVANITVKVHNNNSGGLYINPNGFELVGYGTEIVSTANPNDMFGGQTYNLPAGASATPVSSAPAGVAMPPAAPAAAPVAATPAPAAAPVATTPPAAAPMPGAPAPAALPPPATDFVQNVAAGNPPAAPNAALPPQQPAATPGVPTAAPATGYHGNN